MKNFTLNIVNSMSMNEKRYFKIFCKRHVLGSQNKYLLLFDLINKYKEIDLDLIKSKTKDLDYSFSNLSSDINYLDKILLRSINEFNLNKTINLKIKQNLISIEILFFKGLYKECLTLIKKTKKINTKNENKVLMLELLNWEKKCLGYSKGFYSAMDINNNIAIYYQGIDIDKSITDLYYKSYFLKNNVGKIPADELIIEFDKVLDSPLLSKNKIKFNSIKHEVFHNLIYANYYNILRKNKKELCYLEKTLDVFSANKIYKNENPLDYISIYNRVLDIIKFKKNEVFIKRIEELRSFNTMVSLQKNVVKERIYLHTHKAELEYLIYTDELDKAKLLVKETDLVIKSNKYSIEPYYFIALYYLFSCVHCKLEDYSTGLKFINVILNKYRLKESPRVFIKSELLNIIIHFELKNYALVITKVKNIIKKYNKAYTLNFIEKRLFKVLVKIAKKPEIIHPEIEFTALYKTLSNKDNYEKAASNHFYLSYLKSRIK